MTEPTTPRKQQARDERQARLNDALRENLRRRKAQAQAQGRKGAPPIKNNERGRNGEAEDNSGPS